MGELGSARRNTCRPGGSKKMAAGRFLVVALLIGSSVALRRLRGNQRGNAEPRDERSLANTFPFNANNGEEHHGSHHGNHHDDRHEEPARRAFTGLDSRNQRQGGDDTDVSFPAVAAARPGNDGRRRIVTRTSGRAASLSMSRSPSMRPLRSAGPL